MNLLRRMDCLFPGFTFARTKRYFIVAPVEVQLALLLGMMVVDMSPRILAPVSVLAGVHLVALRDLLLVAALVFRLFATTCMHSYASPVPTCKSIEDWRIGAVQLVRLWLENSMGPRGVIIKQTVPIAINDHPGVRTKVVHHGHFIPLQGIYCPISWGIGVKTQ